MVAATLFPPVRKIVPRPMEMSLWIAFITVCVIGILSITEPRARELTTSAFWGIDQVITTLFGLISAGALTWVSDNRFTIGTATLLVCAADVLVLAVLASRRRRVGWQPRVRLGEWMELPRPAPVAAQPAVLPYLVGGLSRRAAAGLAVAGAGLLAWLVSLGIWARDVLVPRQVERLAHAAAMGTVGSRARLESLRDTASQMQFVARAWYAAAGAPAVNGIAARAAQGVRSVTSDNGVETGEFGTARMADIHVLLSAQSIGWYGPMTQSPTATVEEEEDASGQSGRLAS